MFLNTVEGDSILAVDNWAQLLNAPPPIVVSWFGKTIEVNPLFRNANVPIRRSPAGKLKVVRFEQLANIPSAISVIDEGKLTETRF